MGAAEECGLEISTLISNCLIYNKVDLKIERFLGMVVMEQIECLVVIVSNRRNCFQFHLHKKQKLLQARRMINLT